jgi:hypothetical protein
MPRPLPLSNGAVCLVTDLDKVVTELLDSVGGRSRLDGLGEVSDEDSEGGLDDDNTFLALKNPARQQSNSKPPAVFSPDFADCSSWFLTLPAFATHLLAVKTPVVRLDHNVALLADVETGALALLDVALVVVRGNNRLHFRGLDGEARARGPDAVASAAEDGGLVDVAGADEAVGEAVLVLRCSVDGSEWEGKGTSCQRMLRAMVVSYSSFFGLHVRDDWAGDGYLAKT